MHISEAAHATGLTMDTIRYYERRGIVPAPVRLANGYRDYTDTHVATLLFARGLRDLALPLPLVASLVRLAHDARCEDLRVAMLSSVDATILELETRLQAFRHTRRELRKLRSGLAGMTPRQVRIPGVTRCECVQLVGSATSAARLAAR